MRIDELTIENFKCFEDETFHFNPHFNVVIGKNGSGKSSLLDAVAKFTSFYLCGIDQNYYKHTKDNEIRSILINGQPKKQEPVSFNAKGSHHDIDFTWSERKGHQDVDDPTFSIQDGFNRQPNLPDYARGDLLESRKLEGRIVFPLIVYYGTKRLWSQKDKPEFFKQEEGVFLAYQDCLSGDASSDVFLSWFKTYEDEVAKFHRPTDELFLKIIKEAITSMVPEWSDMAYSRKEEDLIGTYTDESGIPNELPFKNLSDGYRNVIGMVADMVYRCIQLNPGLKENVLTETDGIALIDELDLHLHPEWQRRVAADLKRIFPKVQFIVTTHSPFIIQETEEGELIKIDGGKVSTGGGNEYSLEDVAEYIQGVKDPAWSNKKMEMYTAAKKYFELLNELTPGKGNGELNKIREELNILGKPYSDNVAYTAFLEQKRFLAEQNINR